MLNWTCSHFTIRMISAHPQIYQRCQKPATVQHTKKDDGTASHRLKSIGAVMAALENARGHSPATNLVKFPGSSGVEVGDSSSAKGWVDAALICPWCGERKAVTPPPCQPFSIGRHL